MFKELLLLITGFISGYLIASIQASHFVRSLEKKYFERSGETFDELETKDLYENEC